MGTVVGVTEDWAEDGEGSSVVENRAEGDGRGLDWWEVWRSLLVGRFSNVI